MALLISPILDRNLDLERVPTGLLQLAAIELGGAATPADGHDAAFRDTVNQVNVGGAAVANLDAELKAHMRRLSDAASYTLAGESQRLARDVEKGRQFLGEGPALTAAAAKNAVVFPTAPAPPPPGILDRLRHRRD